MNPVFENRLDGAIPASQFVDRERVEVRTKMGNVVLRGRVMSVVPSGLIIREGDGDSKFFKEDLYIFAALDREPEKPDNEITSGGVEESASLLSAEELLEMTVDERVCAKLQKFIDEADSPVSGKQKETGAQAIEPSETDDIGKPEKGDKKSLGNKDGDDKGGSGDDKKKDDKKDDKKDGDDEKKKKDDKGKGKDEPVVKIDSSVDVDQLPDDIKKSITSAKEMDEAQLNKVLGEISDAAMKGLKRSGVFETSIYKVVQQIQDAAYEILTGNKSPKE